MLSNAKSESLAPYFCKAAKDGDVQAVKSFLSLGINPDINDEYHGPAIVNASEEGYTEIVKMLCKAGVNVNTQWLSTPLCRAAKGGHTEIVKELIDAGADVNFVGSHGGVALMETVTSRNNVAGVVKLLCEAGAELEVKTDNGTTALGRASAYGNNKVVKVLIEAGADIESRNKYGQTPLLHAAKGCHPETMKILIEAGADIEVAVDGEATAMHWAVDGPTAERSARATRVLIEGGIDVNRIFPDGWTYLMFVARKCSGNRLEIVRMLYEAGADPSAKDREGKSIYDNIRKSTSVYYKEIGEILGRPPEIAQK